MIKITVRWMQRLAEIEFPCTDSELRRKLQEVRPSNESSNEIFVLSVHQPTALSMLENQFLDMDEVNFLAKRMDSFTHDELLQFYAAAQYEGFRSPKDLINLTFNLPCYTVIHDFRNMETVGKTHYMNVHGAVSVSRMKQIDFAAIGRELIKSGNGRVTEFGLLFENKEIHFQEVYNGITYPEYYYEDYGECHCRSRAGHQGGGGKLPIRKENLMMKHKVMRVELSTESADARLYYYAALSLPAKSYEVRDAFQRARFHEGDDSFRNINIIECPLLPQLENLRLDSPTVKELAFFSERVDALPVEEKLALKAVFRQHLEDGRLGEVVSVKDLINMTYGLDMVMVIANVRNDEELGQFVIENGLHELVLAVPEDSLYLLDKAKLGKWQRENDKGVYVDDFYVITGDYEMPEVYDGHTFPERPHDTWYAFRLKIAKTAIGSTGETESSSLWVRLPISKAFADEIAKTYKEERIEDCACCGFESSVPQISERQFRDMKEFQKLNRLAYILVQMPPEDQVKFKAALELESPRDMDDVLDIADHLSEYSFSLLPDGADHYFKDYLCHHTHLRLDNNWLDTLSCESEGAELLEKLGGMATPYGVITGRGYGLYDIVPRQDTTVKKLTAQKLTDEKLEVVEVLGQTALFTNGRVTQTELPDGLYCYELRSGEGMDFATVEPHVRSDFAGTLLFKAPLDFGGEEYIAFDAVSTPNFLNHDLTPEEFMNTDFSEEEGEDVGRGGMEL